MTARVNAKSPANDPATAARASARRRRSSGLSAVLENTAALSSAVTFVLRFRFDGLRRILLMSLDPVPHLSRYRSFAGNSLWGMGEDRARQSGLQPLWHV